MPTRLGKVLHHRTQAEPGARPRGLRCPGERRRPRLDAHPTGAGVIRSTARLERSRAVGSRPTPSIAGMRLWPNGPTSPVPSRGQHTARSRRRADFVARMLFPHCVVVCDIHGGGHSLLFPPMAAVHLVDDPLQRRCHVRRSPRMKHRLLPDARQRVNLRAPVLSGGDRKARRTTELGGAAITNGRHAPGRRLATSRCAPLGRAIALTGGG